MAAYDALDQPLVPQVVQSPVGPITLTCGVYQGQIIGTSLIQETM